MEALIRSAGIAAERRSLRQRPDQPPGGALPEHRTGTLVREQAPVRTEPDLAAECERLRAEIVALRRAADESQAERDRQLEQERAALRKAAAGDAERAAAEAAERGHEEGRERGIAEGRESLREQVQRAAALCEALDGARAQAIDLAEDTMVELAFAAVCRILGSDEALRKAVQVAIDESRTRIEAKTTLTVSLHPDDAEALSALAGQARNVKLVGDEQVALGGCRIASSTGTLDARLETQVQRLRTVLLGVRAARSERGARGDA